MAQDFDPNDQNSWFFGSIPREEADRILRQREEGVFLVRESRSIRGDFVLCVKEDEKISHYIINRIQAAGQFKFRIGDQEFFDLPSLLLFYKTHYLDTSHLIRPAPRIKVVAKYDFSGTDQEDLAFKKGEVLEVILKEGESWWTARNSSGQLGKIPVPYIRGIDEVPPTQNGAASDYQQPANQQPRAFDINALRLPARAEVVQQRIPCPFDQRQLRLEVGDIVTVTKVNASGMWEGEVNGKQGIFPFIHIRLLDPDELGPDV